MRLQNLGSRVRHTRCWYVLVNRKNYIIALLILVVILLWFGEGFITEPNSLWNKLFKPFIDLGTFIVAVMVWLGETEQDRRNTLPKRLSVSFMFDNRLLMRCEHAYLAGESDIRALSQIIGKMMAGEDLNFKAPLVRSNGGVERRADGGTPEMHYEATIELISPPKKVQNLPPDEYLLWQPPYVDGIPTKISSV